MEQEVIHMKRRSELMFWSENPEWYIVDVEKNSITLTDKAPERAKKSFEKWKKMNKIK